MPKVQLSPGCRSLRLQDGSRAVAAREGGYVNGSEGEAHHLERVDEGLS